jgi:hypothetical protein
MDRPTNLEDVLAESGSGEADSNSRVFKAAVAKALLPFTPSDTYEKFRLYSATSAGAESEEVRNRHGS